MTDFVGSLLRRSRQVILDWNPHATTYRRQAVASARLGGEQP
jgi:hypothetical protein